MVLAKINFFGNARALDSRLAVAYSCYSSWLKRNKKSGSLNEFSKKVFGMGSLGSSLAYLFDLSLGKCIRTMYHIRLIKVSIWIIWYIYIYPIVCLIHTEPHLLVYHTLPLGIFLRNDNNAFPDSLGNKAFETRLVLTWLENEILLRGSEARFGGIPDHQPKQKIKTNIGIPIANIHIDDI